MEQRSLFAGYKAPARRRTARRVREKDMRRTQAAHRKLDAMLDDALHADGRRAPERRAAP